MVNQTRKEKRQNKKRQANRFVLTKSFDNGEILRQKPMRSISMEYFVRSFATDIPFEEYVVPAAPVSVPVTVADEKKEVERKAVTLPAESPVKETVKEIASTDAEKLAILDNLNKNKVAAPVSEGAKTSAPSHEAIVSKPSSFDYLPTQEYSKQKAAATDDDFEKDMKAILSGEKVFNSETKSMEQRGKKNAPPPRQPKEEAPSTLGQMVNQQSIFDEIAKSMTYAKAYDLGSVDLEKRFNEFDKIAEIQKPKTQPYQPTPQNAPVTRFSAPGPVDNEQFLKDLNSIAAANKGGSPPLSDYLPATNANEPQRRNEKYCYEAPSLVVSKSMDKYSYAQNPGVILGGIAVADAIQIGLGAVSVAQAQAASSQGGFSLTYEKAQRLLTSEARAQMPGSQTSKKIYKQELMWIGELKPGFANASIIIEWEGNAYGEIGTPVIRRDLQNSTDWTKSSANISITRLERIPLPNTDPRTWPVVYFYEGAFNPAGNGKYEFDGEFEINAFGGLTFTKHQVRDRSLIEFIKIGEPEEYVRRGRDTQVPVPEIPEEQLKYLRSKLP